MQKARTGFERFFETLELERISLVETSARCSQDFSLPAKVNLKHEISVEAAGPGKWAAMCKYDLTAVAKEGDDDGLQVSIVYRASYTADGDLDKPARELLADNAVYATWPYMRCYIRSITSEMGLAPLVIGLFKVKFQPAVSKEPKEQAESAAKSSARSRSRKKSQGSD